MPPESSTRTAARRIQDESSLRVVLFKKVDQKDTTQGLKYVLGCNAAVDAGQDSK